jgi:tetratricopeptide (TPR) repeat protein
MMRWIVLAMAMLHVTGPSPRYGVEPAPDAEIARGIAALHDFEYEDANAAFRRARELDPRSVLAAWGEAMSFYQTLWRNENVGEGRAALARLAPTPDARRALASTVKERVLLAAAEQLFGEGDAASRRAAYVEGMARAHAQVPADPDITAFYALALLGTMSRSLIGNGDAHDPALAGSDLQRRVAALLGDVLATHPRHPGALHYLIHAYDDPAHARLALPAARTYAAVAGESSHARHMPAHVFVQLGLWRDAEASDRASWDTSNAWVRRHGLGLALRNYHALAWRQYELLQLGRYREAAALLDDIAPVAGSDPTHRVQSDLSSMRARVAVETRRWDLLAHESNFGNANDLFAIGVSTARTGALDRAEKVRATLAQRATAPEEGDARPAIAIMERELAVTIAVASGRRDEALTLADAAARAELALPAPLGLPLPIKPAPELFGEMLLESGQPARARTAFEQTLQRHANRSLAILGLARAAAALKQTAIARDNYRKLVENWKDGDDTPELREARSGAR